MEEGKQTQQDQYLEEFAKLKTAPAPWKVANSDGKTAYVYSADGEEISQACFGVEDANVIAAGPDCVMALMSLLDEIEALNLAPKMVNACLRANAALRKAKGQAT